MHNAVEYKDIPIEHRCRLKGKYARGIDQCPHCGHEHKNRDTKPSHWVGVAEWSAEGLPVRNGPVIVRECEECFEYFFHHAIRSLYQTYVRGDLYKVRDD